MQDFYHQQYLRRPSWQGLAGDAAGQPEVRRRRVVPDTLHGALLTYRHAL